MGTRSNSGVFWVALGLKDYFRDTSVKEFLKSGMLPGGSRKRYQKKKIRKK
jgi:O-methyltransferase involved in polyketide biosynthesis